MEIISSNQCFVELLGTVTIQIAQDKFNVQNSFIIRLHNVIDCLIFDSQGTPQFKRHN
jgi:hypothetical protein